jgi:uncharacterized protein YjbI with pentapeptide repeats
LNFSTILQAERVANGEKRDVPKAIAEAIRLHGLWIDGNPLGACASMRNKNLRDCLLEGVRLQGVEAERCSFAGAIMKGAWLTAGDFDFADFQACDLRRAYLIDASLYRANLRFADLSGARLRGADLTGADLRDVNFQNADLRNVNFTDAIMRGMIVDSRTSF